MDPLELGPDGKIVLPQPEELSSKEKSDAMGAYLMMFVSTAIGLPLPFLNIIASIIYFAVNAQSRFVSFHAFQSLLSQIAVSLMNAVLISWTVWGLVDLAATKAPSFFHAGYWVYLGVTALANLVYFILSIVAMVHASKGVLFYMPIVGSVSFERYYGQSALHRQSAGAETPLNRPPAR